MVHGPAYFPTKGSCIYCGSTEGSLSDEHIVPLSLGGAHVISRASCEKCAVITSKFELKVARDFWGDARVTFNAPSRRKRTRSKTIVIKDPKDKNKEIEIPVEEYPAGFAFYKMDAPGIIQGLSEESDISGLWKMVFVDDDKKREDFFIKYGGYPTVKFRNIPQEFGQMLAKVGYGQILTMLDPVDFNPICLPYILGQKQNVSYIVGGTGKDPAPTPEFGYSLSTEGFIISTNRLLLIAKVRLYANTHAPEYQVVVGDVTGEENITKVLKKLGAVK